MDFVLQEFTLNPKPSTLNRVCGFCIARIHMVLKKGKTLGFKGDFGVPKPQGLGFRADPKRDTYMYITHKMDSGFRVNERF